MIDSKFTIDFLKSIENAHHPKNPAELAKVALLGLDILRANNVEVTESFYKFANSSVCHHIYNALGATGPTPPAQIIIYFMYSRWATAGLPVFRLSESLAAGLALTDVDNVSTDDWKWPFDTFLLHIPYDFWVMRSPLNDEDDPISMVIVTKMQTMFHEPAAMLIMVGKRGSVSFNQVEMPASPTTFDNWFGRVRTLVDRPISSADSFKLNEAERENVNRCWKLIVNSCLYVTERGRGERQIGYTTKKAKRRQVAPSRNQPEVWIIGKEIKLSKELISAAKQQANNAPAWKINKRFVVRGHYRNQPCGPKLESTKRIFVNPYWKGPQEGERLTHLYTAK